MSLFHQHKWQENSQRVFTGPSGVTKTKRADGDLAERLVWGITTIMQRCEGCGLLRTVEIKGDARITR